MNTDREISNTEDVIDSRDVIDRIESLTTRQAKYAEAQEAGEDVDAFDPLDMQEEEELTALVALAEEGERESDDWPHGAPLIRESYFTEYAQEYAREIVEGMSDAQWPFTHIDWDAAATELSQDYGTVTFDGVDYFIR